jgi:hypothetical protein
LIAVWAFLTFPVRADGPPKDVDASEWCDTNEDACASWCEKNPDEDICQEPECD